MYSTCLFLSRKLKQTIHELCTRCGQQAVVVCIAPGKRTPGYRVFGSSPLDKVVKSLCCHYFSYLFLFQVEFEGYEKIFVVLSSDRRVCLL